MEIALFIIALVLFAISSFPTVASKIQLNLQSLGLAFLTASIMEHLHLFHGFYR